MNELLATSVDDESPEEDGRFLSEIRRDDISLAVEILSTLHGISGVDAYQLLVRGAENTPVTVRQIARMVVMSPGAAEREAATR